ncbi:MAG: ferredoxin [Rhodobacterales bacterium]|nr:MAG: ferredoxin [Rhodobacterales bacterium]
MTLAALDRRAAPHALAVFGALHPDPFDCDDTLPAGTGTVVLFGPREPGFWAHFTAQPEFSDGAADPMDRWSKRVLGKIAAQVAGTAIFPSDGPPYPAFTEWARRSGRAWPSPVGLLVHDSAGLFLSYRGAIAVAETLDLPPHAANPCRNCADTPCVTACPVGALTADTYDVRRCKTYLETPPGQDCMTHGCGTRRACPVSARCGRVSAQSAFHMEHFK